MITIEFISDLGHTVTVTVEGDEAMWAELRTRGAMRWRPAHLPAGGFSFPLENEVDFDWRLIGGRAGEIEGEAGVWWCGQFYKRRELAAVDTKKMRLPAAVKYSRGAKPTDPEHLREKGDAEFEYVTLAVFRGGRRDERFAVPQARPNVSRPAPSVPHSGPSVSHSARPVPHLNHVQEGTNWEELPGTADQEGNRAELTEQLLDALGKKGPLRDAYRRDVLAKLDVRELQKRHAQTLAPGGRS